jgi:hypothetical protein
MSSCGAADVFGWMVVGGCVGMAVTVIWCWLLGSPR